MSERKPCRCLLEDVWPDMARSVQEYLSLLPSSQKTPESVRMQRLAHCRACNMLLDGTCRLCGCYVEARTGRAASACPHVPPLWEACLPEEMP